MAALHAQTLPAAGASHRCSMREPISGHRGLPRSAFFGSNCTLMNSRADLGHARQNLLEVVMRGAGAGPSRGGGRGGGTASRGGGGMGRGGGGMGRGGSSMGRGGGGGRGGGTSRGGFSAGRGAFRPPPRPGGGGQRPPWNNRQQQQDQFSDFTINEDIQAEEVRLLAEDKAMIGVVTLDEALAMAEEQEKDVVLISPDANPPVCRLIDVSKFKYEQEKAVKDAAKKQREARIDVKELKIRPSIGDHDYQVRLRSAQQFISKGDKVKLTLQFKGREMDYMNIARELFEKFVADMEEVAVVDIRAQVQGRQMSMVFAPKKVAVQ